MIALPHRSCVSQQAKSAKEQTVHMIRDAQGHHMTPDVVTSGRGPEKTVVETGVISTVHPHYPAVRKSLANC